MNDFVRDKFAWLRQIATDGNLPGTATKLAIIFCDYFNRESATAWPSINRLARDTGIHARSVQRTITSLVELGHLGVTIGGGRNKTNQYKLIVKPLPAAIIPAIASYERVAAASGFKKIKGGNSCKERVALLPPEPLEENPKNAAGCISADAAFHDFQESKAIFVQAIPSTKKVDGAAQAEQLAKPEPSGGVEPANPQTALYWRGGQIFGKSSIGLVKRLLAAKGGDVNLARAALETASTMADARTYVGAIIRDKTEAERKADLRARGDAW